MADATDENGIHSNLADPDSAVQAAAESVTLFARPAHGWTELSRAQAGSDGAPVAHMDATNGLLAAEDVAGAGRSVRVTELATYLPALPAWALFVGKLHTAAQLGAHFLRAPQNDTGNISTGHSVTGQSVSRRNGTARAGELATMSQTVWGPGLNGVEPRLANGWHHVPRAAEQHAQRRARAAVLQLGLVATTNQRQAMRVVREVQPLFILLETEAKPQSRARFAHMLRRRLPDTRLVAVGARPPSGFDFDAYWEPPLEPPHLAELLAALLAASESHVVERGPIRLDLLTRTVVSPTGLHRLTPKQSALLQLLLDNHGRVVSRREIMEAIWETTFMEDTRTLDVHIRWLRQCIEPDPAADPIYLYTVRGKGYQLRVDDLTDAGVESEADAGAGNR